MHHDQLAGRVDKDGLSIHAQQGKAALLAGKGPGLVAVAEIRRGLVGREGRRMLLGVGGLDQVGRRDDLAQIGAVGALTIVGQQEAQSRIVAGGGIEVAAGPLKPRGVGPPQR